MLLYCFILSKNSTKKAINIAKKRPATTATARISFAEVPTVGSDGGIASESKVTFVSPTQAELTVLISSSFLKEAR